MITGMIIGGRLFPAIREVPVDRVVEKIVERRVQVPVDRIVEKRVEVPVDRVVEKIVEKRVEVPSDKSMVKYVSDRTLTDRGKPSYVISEDRLKLWMQIKKGMTRQQVTGILGPPDYQPAVHSWGTTFQWGRGEVMFAPVSRGGAVDVVTPPEY